MYIYKLCILYTYHVLYACLLRMILFTFIFYRSRIYIRIIIGKEIILFEEYFNSYQKKRETLKKKPTNIRLFC